MNVVEEPEPECFQFEQTLKIQLNLDHSETVLAAHSTPSPASTLAPASMLTEKQQTSVLIDRLVFRRARLVSCLLISISRDNSRILILKV